METVGGGSLYGDSTGTVVGVTRGEVGRIPG